MRWVLGKADLGPEEGEEVGSVWQLKAGRQFLGWGLGFSLPRMEKQQEEGQGSVGAQAVGSPRAAAHLLGDLRLSVDLSVLICKGR